MGQGFGQGFRVSADLFRDALAEIGDDPAARIEIERGLAWSIHETGDVAAAELHARAALELAERLEEPGVLASALADMAFFQTIRGRGIPTALIERALELEDTEDEWRSILGRTDPPGVHGMLLEWAGDLDAARSTLTALRDTVLARGDEHTLATCSHLGRVECLAETGSSLRTTPPSASRSPCRPPRKTERPFALTIRHSSMRTSDAWPKRVPRPTRSCRSRSQSASSPPTSRCSQSAGSSNTRWATLAKPIAFSARFRAVAEAGFGEPALFRFHGDAIETLLALGEHDAATALLAELEEQARATGRVWALTIASRCRALLSAAAGDSDAAYASLDRALELHEQLQSRSSAGALFSYAGRCNAGIARSVQPENR